MVLVASSVAGEELVEMPSTGTIIGRDTGGLAVYFWGQGCVGFIHSNPAEINAPHQRLGSLGV